MASSCLSGIPIVVGKFLRGNRETRFVVVVIGSGISHILNVFASSVSRAVVGAGGSLAGFSSVAIKAIAFATLSIAKTSSGALTILVEHTKLIWRIHPSNLERANSVGAISRLAAKSDPPVIIALANIVSHTSSVATATIVAMSIYGRNASN